MDITFSCDKCGKKLKVSGKHAGQVGKCPACRNRMQIPATPSDYQTEEDILPLADEGDGGGKESAGASSQPAPRSDGVIRSSSGATLMDYIKNISIFGIGLKKLVTIGILISVAVGAYYYFTSGDGIDVGKPRVVDVYTALTGVRYPKAIELIKVAPIVGIVGRADTVYERSLLFGGEESVAIIRPTPNAGYLVIPVSVTQKYLIDNKASRKWTVSIRSSHFELISGERRQKPLLLATAFKDFVRVDKQATIELGGIKVSRMFNPDKYEFPTYPPVVQRDSGIRVEYTEELDGRLLVARWNKGCEAWQAMTDLEKTKAYLDSNTTEVLLLFDRPESNGNPLKLEAFGKVVAEIPHTFGY